MKTFDKTFDGKYIPSSEITYLLNDYLTKHSWNDSHNFLIKFLEKNNRLDEAKAMKKVHEHEISPSSGFVAKMLLAGATLDQTYIDYMERVGISDVLKQGGKNKHEELIKINDSIINAAIDYVRSLCD